MFFIGRGTRKCWPLRKVMLKLKFLKFLAVFLVLRFSKLYLYDRRALRNCCSVREGEVTVHTSIVCLVAHLLLWTWNIMMMMMMMITMKYCLLNCAHALIELEI